MAILAGGLATRLGPLAKATPKVLLDIAGKPFAQRQIELLSENGLDDLVFCVGNHGDQVERALGDGAQFGVRIRYAHDGDRLAGTGGAVIKALPKLGHAFFVLYGDTFLDIDYRQVEQAFLDAKTSALMTVFDNQGRWDQSNVVFRDGRIVRYDKRSPTDEMHHIDYGLGVFDAVVFRRYEPAAPLDLADVYQDVLAQGGLAGFEVTRRFYEIGSTAGLAETREYFKERMDQES